MTDEEKRLDEVIHDMWKLLDVAKERAPKSSGVKHPDKMIGSARKKYNQARLNLLVMSDNAEHFFRTIESMEGG